MVGKEQISSAFIFMSLISKTRRFFFIMDSYWVYHKGTFLKVIYMKIKPF